MGIQDFKKAIEDYNLSEKARNALFVNAIHDYSYFLNVNIKKLYFTEKGFKQTIEELLHFQNMLKQKSKAIRKDTYLAGDSIGVTKKMENQKKDIASTAISNKIKAYGLRKDGTKVIIRLLNEAQGYSRKFDVLYKMSIRILKSEQKFTNGLNELKSFGFIKSKTTPSGVKRIMLDKRIWDRDSDIIKLEHRLIKNRLNKNSRWLNPKNLIRDVRTAIEEEIQTKPAYYSVESHLKIFLSQNDYDEDENGLIRLAKLKIKEKIFNPTEKNLTSLFDFDAKNGEQNAILTEQETSLNENKIDSHQDEDIFEIDNDGDNFEESYDININNDDEGIDVDIFSSSPDNNTIENLESIELTKEETTNSNFGASNYLKAIVEAFSDKKGFIVSESFNEISIKINGIKIVISYDPSRKELTSLSRHSLKDNEIIEALKMYGKSYMIGRLSIDAVKGVDLLQLGQRFFVTKYDMPEIISMIEKIIYEAIQLERI